MPFYIELAIGIRSVSSSSQEDYQYAETQGSTIYSVKDVRSKGTEAVLAHIPKGERYYITIDIDGFDPSIAPGTGTPSHGGFLYYEVQDMLKQLVGQGQLVGCDIVEVAPPYDPSGITAFLAARLAADIVGYYTYGKSFN